MKIIDDSYAFSNALNGFKLHYRKMGKSLFLTIIDKFNFFKGILLGNECVRADHAFALGVFALGGFAPSSCLWVFSTWIEYVMDAFFTEEFTASMNIMESCPRDIWNIIFSVFIFELKICFNARDLSLSFG